MGSCLVLAAAAVGVVFLAQSQHTTKYERVNTNVRHTDRHTDMFYEM